MNEELNPAFFHFVGENWSLSIEHNKPKKAFDGNNRLRIENKSSEEICECYLDDDQLRCFINMLHTWASGNENE